MLKIVHLLDDFGMGGVVRALGVFDEPELARGASSDTVPIARNAYVAPKLDADVIITHFPASWARMGFFWTLRLRNPKARLIHIEHSYTRSFEHHNVPNTNRFRMLLRLALRHFDEIVCVSDGQRKWLTGAVGLEPGRCRTIHPWSGRQELLAIPAPERRSGRPLRLAAYGRFSEVKNFAALIDAVAKIGPSVELQLAGSGPDEADLHRAAQAASNITTYGPISDIGGFLKSADAVIVPSKWEAFGLVATEARLAARPIIVGDIDGLPEQVGNAGLAAKCDSADDIMRAIERFQTLPFDQMSHAARQEVSGMRGQIIGQWIALLQS